MLIIIFLLGLIIGSFLNVVALRILKNEEFVRSTSHCESCNHRLYPWDLVPLFSFLFLKGKCRYCKEKLSLIYPAGELLTAISYTIMFHVYGFSIEGLINIIFITFIILSTITDLRERIVPNSFIFIGFILVLFMRIIYNVNILNYLISSIFAFLFLLLIYFLSNGKLGGADIKIYALIGLGIGIKNAVASLFLASMVGTLLSLPIIIKKRSIKNIEMPFIPFITIGILMTYFIDVFKGVLN